MHPMTEKKNFLKETSFVIRKLKKSRKQENRDGRDLEDIWRDLWRESYIFRLNHIAYCLVRGRKYEEIEQPKNSILGNFDWNRIHEIQKELQEKVDAANKEWELKKAV